MTTPEDNMKADDVITQMMKDIAGDPNLNPDEITAEMLRAKGLEPAQIEQIMKLKNIHDDLKDGKPVDVSELKNDLKEIQDDIKDNIQNKKAEKKKAKLFQIQEKNKDRETRWEPRFFIIKKPIGTHKIQN